mmetsp:Transcript_5399/g.15678  ORF Transcript_5399/g.15678 Transcript_5399/m.15678 type:complete len:205 (+) Transcript_5399:335-949(+)
MVKEEAELLLQLLLLLPLEFMPGLIWIPAVASSDEFSMGAALGTTDASSPAKMMGFGTAVVCWVVVASATTGWLAASIAFGTSFETASFSLVVSRGFGTAGRGFRTAWISDEVCTRDSFSSRRVSCFCLSCASLMAVAFRYPANRFAIMLMEGAYGSGACFDSLGGGGGGSRTSCASCLTNGLWMSRSGAAPCSSDLFCARISA